MSVLVFGHLGGQILKKKGLQTAIWCLESLEERIWKKRTTDGDLVFGQLVGEK